MLEKSVFKNSVKLGHRVILCFEILNQRRRIAFGKIFLTGQSIQDRMGDTARVGANVLLIRVQKNRKKVLGFLRNSYLI